jgi:hypothetical protein
MEYGYSNRHYLLPEGCKDLIDAIHMPRQINTEVIKRDDGIIFKFKVTELRQSDADIVIEGRHLRIIEKCPDNTRREKILYVSHNYDLGKALTTYTEDEVRIFVPKC